MDSTGMPHQRMLDRRIILLGRSIDDAEANRVASQLLVLSAEDPTADIALYINTPGGSVAAGLTILDTMRLLECDVATCVIGMAASMGQLLLSAGAPGKRQALPHSRVVMNISPPTSSGAGTESFVTTQAELFTRHKLEMAELLAQHTNQAIDRIMVDIDRGKWFTAQEAVDYGFVDRVADRPRRDI